MKKMEDTYICDEVSNAPGYEGYGANFRKAVAFLSRKDLARLPTGRYEIDGENAYANIVETQLKTWEAARAEIHRSYFDIHVPLSGPETIGIARIGPSDRYDFNEADDSGFCDDVSLEPVTLEPGEFMIVHPGTCAHAPCCSLDGGGIIRKIIIKVKA